MKESEGYHGKITIIDVFTKENGKWMQQSFDEYREWLFKECLSSVEQFSQVHAQHGVEALGNEEKCDIQ